MLEKIRNFGKDARAMLIMGLALINEDTFAMDAKGYGLRRIYRETAGQMGLDAAAGAVGIGALLIVGALIIGKLQVAATKNIDTNTSTQINETAQGIFDAFDLGTTYALVLFAAGILALVFGIFSFRRR